ncbi:MAG: hypothetical protein ABMA14_17420 [Hyphomonadaceae bacterium]
MKTIEELKTYHLAEIGRLTAKVEAARLTDRNVDLERALILEHSHAMAALDFGREATKCSKTDQAG